ncbi:hypothetical protein B0T25DRAFT_550213 [Lasiosphaeria hispida]|uniref:Uncharacterized protein n=1 Tax=Lasiosphaeria hispida TaxID=260671 RepID=A0AAJ0MD77_9PEZI|nr:hypothetical protein B0T25DRAFT_550213 [Lasiosphaeria hispida]
MGVVDGGDELDARCLNNQSTLQSGLEIELILGSRKKTYPNWKTPENDVSKRLLKASIPNHINDTNEKSTANYTEWFIVPEITIPNQPAKNLWDRPPH